MIAMRCKCGKHKLSTSMGTQDCMGCEDCKTTFATSPEGHKPLQPHEWQTKYNQNTGKSFKVCKNCFHIDKESYELSKIKGE